MLSKQEKIILKLLGELNGESNPEEIATGRANWKQWKDAGHTLTYWQQSEQGKWEQKG